MKRNATHSFVHTQTVESFQDFVETPFQGYINAIAWKRTLEGDFAEIIQKLDVKENIKEISEQELYALQLSEQGQIARDTITNDLLLLKEHGASPVLNVIHYYERDEDFPLLPTDVYSFHVDRSPIPTETILCTYHGAASEIVPNEQATQKILIPSIKEELKKFHQGTEETFDSFCQEFFFDLHYQAHENAEIMNLGLGNIWKLAVDHPTSQVLPCLHRAPKEIEGEKRLLLIC